MTESSSIDDALGLASDRVELRSHDKRWHQIFERERAEIVAVLGELALGVEHVGSTAIEGIVAKPIVDIAVAVESFERGEECIEPLARIGFVYKGEHGLAGRRYFTKGEPRRFHLHMYAIDDSRWRDHLLFRDYLRCHADVAGEYDRLKRKLAERFATSRLEYTEAKEPFISRVLAAAVARTTITSQ